MVTLSGATRLVASLTQGLGRNDMKNILIVLFITFLCGCSNDPNNLNGKYVKDVEGKIYRVTSKSVDTYFLTRINADNFNALLNSTEYKKLKNEE